MDTNTPCGDRAVTLQRVGSRIAGTLRTLVFEVNGAVSARGWGPAVQLFVFPAMKMEVKFKAPTGMSVVQEVRVKAGRKMVEGALLAKLA